MKKQQKILVLLTITLVAMIPDVAMAGLEQMTTGATSLIMSLAKLLNVGAALVGGWFVVSGVMNWKKSSNEHGGGQIEFKSVVIPIITGIILVAFTGFVAMTSSTFGFASNTGMFG